MGARESPCRSASLGPCGLAWHEHRLELRSWDNHPSAEPDDRDLPRPCELVGETASDPEHMRCFLDAECQTVRHKTLLPAPRRSFSERVRRLTIAATLSELET